MQRSGFSVVDCVNAEIENFLSIWGNATVHCGKCRLLRLVWMSLNCLSILIMCRSKRSKREKWFITSIPRRVLSVEQTFLFRRWDAWALKRNNELKKTSGGRIRRKRERERERERKKDWQWGREKKRHREVSTKRKIFSCTFRWRYRIISEKERGIKIDSEVLQRQRDVYQNKNIDMYGERYRGR